MLSGIKRGTKKRKAPSDGSDDVRSDHAATKNVAASAAGTANSSAADELRLALQQGHVLPPSQRTNPAGDSEREINLTDSKTSSNDVSNSTAFAAASRSLPSQRLDNLNDTADLSLSDLVRQEKQKSSMSHAQQEMQNIVRRNKRQGSRLKAAMDSDEEEERQSANVFGKSKRASSDTASRPNNNRNHHHPMAMDSCWWWFESSRFDQRRLLGRGRYVTLSLAPLSRSLIAGAHLYLVPIPHVTAWTHCDDVDTVWMELRKFQASLRAWARSIDKGVLFWETVLVNQGAKQTRLEAILLPLAVCQDAPLYFRSALTEIAEEWGTHQSIISTKYNTKEVRNSIPKNFSYFYVEYGHNDEGAGHAQMIESKSFPQDFGVDTIAGMMRLDPLRFRSNQAKNEVEEREIVRKAVEQLKPFDWTSELQG